MYTARNLEDALEAPLEVGELFLAGRGLTDFPMEVFQLVNLRVLDLSQNLIRVLPEGIGGLAELTVLNLRNNQLRALPVEIGQLQGLQRLDLEENQLAELPIELALCDGLRSLRLNDNCFAAWPAAALSPRVENLTMGYNQLKVLPESIRHLHALTYLDLRHNRLASLPENLALIEGLETVLLEGNPLALSVESVNPEGVLERFFKEMQQHQGKASRAKFPPMVRRCWLRMLMGTEDLLADFKLDVCVAALDAPLSVVREAARAVLPVLVPSPLPKTGPAHIVFVGQFPGISKVEVERALAAADIVVLRRLSGDASVIVALGERPGEAVRARVLGKGNPLAFEGHLVNWLAASKGEYLNAAPIASPMQENLGRLIRSYKKENIEIALMMMAKGGTSSGLLTDLLAVRLFHGDEEVRQKAGEAFSQLADKTLKAFVDRQLAQSYKENEYYDVQGLVQALMRNPGLDAGTLVRTAMALKGASTALVMLLPEAMRAEHLQSSLQDGQLQLSGIGLTEFPVALEGLDGLRHLMLSRNQLAVLPVDLGPFSRLEMLDLAENHLTELPESISVLQRLLGLDLSQNRLRYLPDAMGKLASLEALRLDRNPLQGLPSSLSELGRLEMLGLYGCRLGEVPDVVWGMSQLRALDLGECNLSSLPGEIPGFPQLESLGLKDNPLVVVPNWVGELPSLRFLDLSLLPARELPGTLWGHGRLERIYLVRDDSMDWEQVIPVLGSMPRLRYVYLRGRKIVRAMQLRIEEGLPSVRVFFG